MATLLDPAACGPVTLAFCQDTQTEAWDFPAAMLEPVDLVHPTSAAGAGRAASRRSRLCARRARRSSSRAAACSTPPPRRHSISWLAPAGFRWRRRRPDGARSTGSTRNRSAPSGSPARARPMPRQPPPTWCSQSVPGCRISPPPRAHCFPSAARLLQVNVNTYDAHKHGAAAIVGDAREVLEGLRQALAGHRVPQGLERLGRGRAHRVGRGLESSRASARSGRGRPIRRAGHRRGRALGAERNHGRLRGRRPSRRAAQACGGPGAREATTSNTASPAWDTRSRAASA